MAAQKKPEPVSTRVVCSICGLNWDTHPADPTLLDCVELLKGELARRVVPLTVPSSGSTYSAAQQQFGKMQ
jgi:hypothetical protein